MKIVNCLVNQILTYSTLRDTIDDACQRAKQARFDLRAITAMEQKTEKELKYANLFLSLYLLYLYLLPSHHKES